MELLGRDDELACVDETIASARARRGRAVFVTGDAGLGKTTVLDAARARAEAAGLTVLAGAAWEAGGAPSYWPWLRVLRDAADAFGASVRELPGAARIATLVPEWGQARGGDTPDPKADRFALLDAVARGLVALSSQAPLGLLLDDLHAADLPSLELLALFVRDLPRAAIALIGAWREGELAARPEVAQQLARASRHAVVRPLRRLTADEVGAWATRRGGDGAALFAFSEGNPLFVEEALRARHAGVPISVDAVLRDHLALLSTAAREVTDAAAVLGRDASRGSLRAITGADDAALDDVMREAAAAGVVAAREDGWTFTHVLLRDHLYAALPAARRSALHRAAGAVVDAADPTGVRAAHHQIRGAGEDPAHVATAIAAARAAAERASRLYAFEDAATLLDAARGALEAIGRGADREAGELRLAAAIARRSRGATRAAQVDALAAMGVARALGDADLLARGAMEYAAELFSGRRDQEMINVLEEALAALPPDDLALRARLLARLGTALSPPINPDDPTPTRHADDAVAIARRLGDDDALLYTLRFRGHTYGYFESYAQQRDVTLELIALSARLGRPLETLDQHTWLINAYQCAGDLEASDRVLDDVLTLLAPLHPPQYRWRTPILRAARAILRGDLVEAHRYRALASAIARDHQLDRAHAAALFLGMSLLQADPTRDFARELLEDARAFLVPTGRAAAGAFAFVELHAGNEAEARVALASAQPTPAVIVSQFALEAAIRLGDVALTARFLPLMQRGSGMFPVAIGPAGSASMCPSEIVVGEGLLAVGRRDEGVALIERGAALARSLHAPRYVARAEAALARAGQRPAPAATEAPSVCVEAERVRVRWRGREHVLAPSKGLAYLALLLDAASREIHVSELVGDDDHGDAGEVIDGAARDAYRARALALRAELDDAEARHDLGRAELARAELDALTEQLTSAIGLGGRARRAASHVERARINVQRRVRDAIRRVAEVDPELGRYLEASIRTGTFCAFVPLP